MQYQIIFNNWTDDLKKVSFVSLLRDVGGMSFFDAKRFLESLLLKEEPVLIVSSHELAKTLQKKSEQLGAICKIKAPPEEEEFGEEDEDYGQGYEMGEEFAEGLLEEIQSIRDNEELLDTALRGFVDGFNAEMESNGINLELSHLMQGWREDMMESYKLKNIIDYKRAKRKK